MKRIKIDRKKCIGCLTCTTACKVAHGGRDTRIVKEIMHQFIVGTVQDQNVFMHVLLVQCKKIMKLAMHFMIKADVQHVLCA